MRMILKDLLNWNASFTITTRLAHSFISPFLREGHSYAASNDLLTRGRY
ncbi:hypothetical protein HALO59_120209 [Halomonas sp. 59]|nr:hypothetical protein HALO113_120210 [Halomonas sp. 113]CAD5251943.1 hypothetical protein HALO59_120209 [Halomonas sp. 59]CAD5259274.1 hypothetical protein HALOI3_150174 [Halomonas sp. I3]CAD5295838.1 hypothetical protein HALO156_90051 [Halomonas sp. 156]VXB05743.1 hypothetical protein HALO98_120068 [Halomonas titanicae]